MNFTRKHKEYDKYLRAFYQSSSSSIIPMVGKKKRLLGYLEIGGDIFVQFFQGSRDFQEFRLNKSSFKNNVNYGEWYLCFFFFLVIVT